MDIVVLSHDVHWGGAEQSLVEMCEILKAKYENLHIHFILSKRGELSERLANFEDVHLHFIPFRWWVSTNKNVFRRWIRVLLNRFSSNKIKNLLVQISPQVAITNTICTDVLASSAKEVGIPHVWFVHEMTGKSLLLEFDLGFSSAVKHMAGTSEKLIFNSKTTANFYSEKFNQENKSDFNFQNQIHEESIIIYPTVSDNFSRSTDNVTFWSRRAHNVLKLLNVSTIQRGKNQIRVVKTLKMLKESSVHVQTDFYGSVADDEYMNELLSFVSENQLQENVKYKGFVQTTPKLYQQYDALVHFGENEAFGKNVAEAFFSKTPVFMYNSGSAKEMLGENSERGWIFDSESDLRSLLMQFNSKTMDSHVQEKVENASFFAHRSLSYEQLKNETIALFSKYLG